MRRRRNLLLIFNNSAVIPFKWRGRYLCFYCSKDLAEYTELRRHTTAHGDCSIGDHSMKVLKGGQNMEVKVDVSDLSCRACGLPQTTLDALLDHLGAAHQLQYDRTVDMAIEEYRLADLKCLSCEATFTYFGYLVSHVNSTHPKNCLICDSCDQRFNKKRDLFSHMKNYHREGGYTCELCPMSFPSLNVLRKHKSNRHITRCEVCQLRLPSAALKQKHMNMEHPDNGSLQCDNCSKEFHTRQGLRMHSRKCKGLCDEQAVVKREPPGVMDLDDGIVDTTRRPSVKRIRENIVTVINMSTALPFNFYKNKFNCFYCSMDFDDSDSMRAHTVAEHPVCDVKQKCIRKCRESVACVKIDVSELACKLCSRPLDGFDELIDHLTSVHGADYDRSITGCLQPYRLSGERVPCPLCPEQFRFFGTLLKHMNSAHAGNRLICAHCGRAFGREQNLRVHVWRHHAAGRFRCAACALDCGTPSALYAHMAKAHGARTAKCPQCPEAFATQHSRQRHLIDAHGSGHRCAHCGKLFTRASFARDHALRTHLKVRDAVCAVCGARFFNGALLRRHMRRHGGAGEPGSGDGGGGFGCAVCGERFRWRRGLRAHATGHCSAPAGAVAVGV
ncbi:unnamed protein product, partial [Iphiclides podalirius]